MASSDITINVRVADYQEVRTLIDACRALDDVICEFPREPEYWGEHLQRFQRALAPFDNA